LSAGKGGAAQRRHCQSGRQTGSNAAMSLLFDHNQSPFDFLFAANNGNHSGKNRRFRRNSNRTRILAGLFLSLLRFVSKLIFFPHLLDGNNPDLWDKKEKI
jgi:hypothetical protein